ncbi:MAG: hypothetical protein AAGA03_11700 [Planctomycetota bacterium]
MVTALMIAAAIFVCAILFLCVLNPLIAMIECLMSNALSGGAKAFWILFTLLTWAMGGNMYALFASHSGGLRKFSWSVVLIALVSLGTCFGLSVADPQLVPQIQKMASANGAFDLEDLQEINGLDTSSISEMSWGMDAVDDAMSDMKTSLLIMEAQSAAMENDYPAALKKIDEAIAQAPNSYQAKVVRGGFLKASGQTEQANNELLRAAYELTKKIEAEPTNPELYSVRADCWKHLDDRLAAIKDVKEAIRLTDGDTSLLELKLNLLDMPTIDVEAQPANSSYTPTSDTASPSEPITPVRQRRTELRRESNDVFPVAPDGNTDNVRANPFLK